METYAKQEEEDELTASTRAAATVARRLLAKIPELLGGNLRVVVSGGAPLSPTLSYFFQGLGIEVLEGYGTTE
ncbi:AMP-binding protein, partial [Streptococcus agalactiae]|uniref:AMP-binding protein n=1 Tax=Streptococcus agalactiae TaxID=1311 RepID=UPI002555CE87